VRGLYGHGWLNDDVLADAHRYDLAIRRSLQDNATIRDLKNLAVPACIDRHGLSSSG
jgi:hypothetical protein